MTITHNVFLRDLGDTTRVDAGVYRKGDKWYIYTETGR